MKNPEATSALNAIEKAATKPPVAVGDIVAKIKSGRGRSLLPEPETETVLTNQRCDIGAVLDGKRIVTQQSKPHSFELMKESTAFNENSIR